MGRVRPPHCRVYKSVGVTTVVYVGTALFGLIIGSFLNVVIYRFPRRESLSHPGSHCPDCGAPVRPYDNIPVVSWLVLRGRCRDCHGPISPRYPLVELLTGVLFLAAGVRFGSSAPLAAYCVFFAVLVAISGIDLDHHLIPNRIVYPGGLAVLALLALASGVQGSTRSFVDALIGGVLGFGVLLIIHLIQPRGMGFGDVRLAGLIGLASGWLGVAHVAVALFMGFLSGAIVGLVLMAAGRAGRRSRIPFGPFLAVGAVVAVLWGNPLVRAWLG